MEPLLTWLDFTSRDRDKMRRVLDLFSEQGTVDEMGLGSLRDALADELFPGTSSLQTRLRYVLFVPWMYKALENKRVTREDLANDAKTSEIRLIDKLMENEDKDGVIGARARARLSRRASSVFWSAISRWNIFQHDQSQSWYHAHFSRLTSGREGVGRSDDPGVVWTRQPNWHVRMPSAPPSFPDAASFAMTHEESDFVRGRIEERCAGTLLAWFAREGSKTATDAFWDESSLPGATPSVRRTVELARRFSRHVEGAPLLYNLLLAERRHAAQGTDQELVDQYRGELEEWGAREADEAPFDAGTLWALVAQRGGTLRSTQRLFVEGWGARIRQVTALRVADDAALRYQVEQRELQLKTVARARLANPARLLDWSGRVGVGRMDFRWFRVRQMLMDLHQGLAD